MEPGMHGCVTPCAPALADHLALLAKYNPGGCHIFLSRHALNRKDFEYQYQGFYRVTQKDMRSYSEDKPKAKLVASGSDSGEESHLVFFLQFLGYDREVFNALDRFVMNEGEKHKLTSKEPDIYTMTEYSPNSTERHVTVSIMF